MNLERVWNFKNINVNKIFIKLQFYVCNVMIKQR